MEFQSIHPTVVPDPIAQQIFLALAHRWTAVPAADLARAFVRCSLYENELPKSFGANMSGGGRFAVLVEGLAAASVEPFKITVNDRHSFAFVLAAATKRSDLPRVWGMTEGYGRMELLELETAAQAYRSRCGEEHARTLAAVTSSPTE